MVTGAWERAAVLPLMTVMSPWAEVLAQSRYCLLVSRHLIIC